jgi:cytochrome P450
VVSSSSVSPSTSSSSSSSSSSRPLPPQVKGWPVVGAPWMFGKDMHRGLAAQHDTLGDVYFFTAMGRRIWMLRDPALVEQVLMTDRELWQKTDSPAYDALRTLLGEGLVTAEGPAWLKHRRLAQPAFHRERIAGFTEIIARCAADVADAFAASARAGAGRDLAADMLAFTQRVIAKTMLSIDIDAAEGESLGAALDKALHAVERRANAPVSAPLWLPTKNNRDLKSARTVLDALVYSVIDERRAARAAGHTPEGKGDLLDMLLDAVDEDSGERLTREELRDDVMTIFLAGHETTSNLLSWTFVALAQHADIADALANEWAGRDPREAARPSSTSTLLDRVVDESLRWRPPVWTVDRVAQRAGTLGPYAVDAGDIVLVSPWAMHHHARYWPEPERFDPERFAPSQSSTSTPPRPRFAYFPFLAGNRKCIGDTFALAEAKIALATWIPRFRFVVDAVPAEELAITMRPEGGVPARISVRGSLGEQT